MHRTCRDTGMNLSEATVSPTALADTPRGIRLYGRSTECRALDQLVADVRAGQSRVLILRGETGAGKSVLLDYLAGRASGSGCRVARVAGVRSETGLAFAGLHQLWAPMLGCAERLPVPQRDALQTVSGLAAGPSPDRFFVGLAVLSMLAEVAGEGPLICLVDDEQWLDRTSAQVLGFAARRLDAGPVGLVFATSGPSADLAGLPELDVEGLREEDARALLASALPGPLDARVADMIIAETRGNPRALLELLRDMSPAELAGGFGLPGAAPAAGRVEDSFASQLDALPDQTRRLVQLAAADPSGDSVLVWRAAGRLGIPVQAGAPAVEAGLVKFGARVRFWHPLARWAAYRSASFSERQQLHTALAEMTDPKVDPDRRAWHRAQAAAGPDEEVAAELERSAGQAQARGGLAAAAAFLERSALLTVNPTRHAGRVLAAARANVQAGAFGKALDLLAEAAAGPLDEFASAQIQALRGQVAFASGQGGDALPPLLEAAKRLEPLDAGLARETYLAAWMAALFAGRLAAGGDLLEVCRAARALPPPEQPRTVDLVLDGLALIVTDGPAAAAPALRRAVSALADAGIAAEEALRWGWLAQAAASMLWDDDAWRALLVRQVRLARAVGALGQLPAMLDALGAAVAATGDFAAASALIAEACTIRAVTGARAAPRTAMMLASLRGRHAGAAPLIAAASAEAEASGHGIAVACAHWAAAILHNGLGRYADALTAARQASEDTSAPHISTRALPELVEAATRAGDTALAHDAVKQLAEITQPYGTDSALGIEARCRALLSDGSEADGLYDEAIQRLGRTELRPELARAHLLYGEWLRREGRRTDAREQLRAAHDMLAGIGMEAFAERARRELLATGETVRKRGIQTATTLTAQEAVIAKLARDGRTNPEIGTQLFLSARTVEWHLRKIFTKLGISSRRELRAALPRAA
jgi:DNA-binding CsgD family transcriptional regulator/tetratricopeptide (TPR) repeat protein